MVFAPRQKQRTLGWSLLTLVLIAEGPLGNLTALWDGWKPHIYSKE